MCRVIVEPRKQIGNVRDNLLVSLHILTQWLGGRLWGIQVGAFGYKNKRAVCLGLLSVRHGLSSTAIPYLTASTGTSSLPLKVSNTSRRTGFWIGPGRPSRSVPPKGSSSSMSALPLAGTVSFPPYYRATKSEQPRITIIDEEWMARSATEDDSQSLLAQWDGDTARDGRLS